MVEVRRERLLLWGACAIAIFAVVFALAQSSWLLTNDGPQHLINSFINLHYTDSSLRWDETWVINESLTAHGYKEVFSLLEPLFGWERAHWLAVCAPIPVTLVGWTLLLDRLDVRGRWPMLFLLGALSISWPLWIGLMPFVYAASAMPYILYFSADRQLHLKSSAIISMMLLAQAHAHPLPAMVGGVILFAWVGPRHLGRLVLIGLPSALFSLWVRIASRVGGPTADQMIPGAITGPLPFVTEPIVGQWLVLFLVVLSFFWLLKERRILFGSVCGVLFLSAYVVPDTVGGWGLVSPRFQFLVVPLLLAFAPLERLRGLFRWTIVASLTLVSLWSVADDIKRSRLVEADFAPIIALLEADLPDLTGQTWDLQLLVGPIPADYNVAFFAPGLHLAQILAVTRGGVPSWTQSGDPALHTLLGSVLRPSVDFLHPAFPLGGFSELWESEWRFPSVFREEVVASLLTRSESVHRLFIIGMPQDRAAIERAGFRVEVLGESPDKEYSMYSARFEGCNITLNVSSLGFEIIEFGVLRQDEPTDIEPISSGDTQVNYNAYPCGRYWVVPCGDHGVEYSVVTPEHPFLNCSAKGKQPHSG